MGIMHHIQKGSSYCLRRRNDTNSWEDEQLRVLIDHTTSSTQLVLSDQDVVSLPVFIKSLLPPKQLEKDVLTKVTSTDFSIYRIDNRCFVPREQTFWVSKEVVTQWRKIVPEIMFECTIHLRYMDDFDHHHMRCLVSACDLRLSFGFFIKKTSSQNRLYAT